MTTSEKIEYLLSKVNWGASFLDAQAITIMNEVIPEIKTLEIEKAELETNYKFALDLARANGKELAKLAKTPSHERR